MFGKIIKVFVSVLLLCFSFYSTNLIVDIVRSNDPIMKQINKEKSNYEDAAVDAVIVDDTITPGVNGVKVEVNKSFKTMFQYGSYDDRLYTFFEVSPAISINDYYDKYIVSGRDDSMDVGIVFTVSRDDDIIDLLTVLSDNNVTATFFVDGLFLENNRSFIKNMIENKYEVELFNYNGNYQEIYFKNALSILNDIRGEKSNFCFSSYKRSKVLNLCKNLQLHTVIPTIDAKTYPYKNIKNNLKGGSIIYMSNNIDELEMSINYIKQKGFNLVRLDKLLDESEN